MKGRALNLFSIEVKGSYRSFKERTTEHPFMTSWFVILLIVGFWTLLMIVEFAKNIEDPLITLTEADVLFAVFFIIMAKSSVETLENTLRNKELKYYFSSAIPIRKVQISRLLKVFWYNLILVAISLGVVSVLIPIFGFSPPVNNSFFYRLYLICLIAPMIGFNLGTFMQVKGLGKRVVLLLLYGQNISLIWLSLQSSIAPKMIFFYLSLLGVFSLLVFLSSAGTFWDAWKHGTTTSTDRSLRFHDSGDFLPKFIPSSTRRVAEKEIMARWRRRESPATMGVTVMLGAGLIFFYTRFGPTPNLGLGLGKYMYPLLIGLGLYIAVILQIVFPSLSLVGKEGKAFWVLRSLPVKGDEIIWGKIFAILAYSPIIVASIALPLPLLLSYPLSMILFSIISSILVIFLLSGVGIWAAAKFPNFDESVNGAPDVTTMYTVMITCMILLGLFLSIPAFIFRIDRVLGLLALIFMADMSALFLLLLGKRAGKIYEKIQMDF